MPVELDVNNRDERLAPGMFAEVSWPVHRTTATLFVPVSAVVESMEKTFVEVVRNDRIKRVSVKRGRTQKELVEVFGALTKDDLVVTRGTEELADGTKVNARPGATAAASAIK